jgi:hypothetical protein
MACGENQQTYDVIALRFTHAWEIIMCTELQSENLKGWPRRTQDLKEIQYVGHMGIHGVHGRTVAMQSIRDRRLWLSISIYN